jgi:hypothetical protein
MLKLFFYYFFKIIFNINTSKCSKNTKNINLKKIKKYFFFKSTFKTQKQTGFSATKNISKLD